MEGGVDNQALERGLILLILFSIPLEGSKIPCLTLRSFAGMKFFDCDMQSSYLRKTF